MDDNDVGEIMMEYIMVASCVDMTIVYIGAVLCKRGHSGPVNGF